MRYDVKVIINGVEVTDQASDSSPSITGVSYQNSVSEGPLQIGTAAVDKLTFTLLNPYKASFDGDKVEFWVNPDEDEEGVDRLSELEELIGDETDDEGIDEDDTDVYEDETEEDGEDLTDEELEESEAEEAELDAKVIEQVNGESTDNEEAEETDEAEEETWRLIGTFFVYKQKQTDTGIQLTCYDSMMFLHGSYTPDTATDTVQNHYNAFRTACQEETGVPIDEMEFDDAYNKTITWDFTCSYRDALGYFAGLVGGYAHADADGEIGISFYLASDITLLSEELLSYNEESAGELVLDGMSCNRSRATNLTTDLIETGAGQAVSFTNPFVDESMLEDIFDMYRGVRYIGASLSCKWDESLQAGELIRIMSEAEYENWLRMNNAADAAEDEETEKKIRLQMAQLGKMVLIGTQTIVFAGEAVSTIRSTSRAETAKENEMISPWKKSAMELADAAASAQETAGAASTAAAAAGNLASAAKTTAEAAQEKAKATAAHFWSDSEGAHVTYTEEGEAIAKGNVLISTDGLSVRDGGTTVASFGENGAIIGKDGTQQVLITSSEFKAVSGEGEVSARIASMRSKDAKEITEAPSLKVRRGESKTYTPSFTPEPGTTIAIKFKLARSGTIETATRTFTAGKSDELDSRYEKVLVAANGSVTMHYKVAAPNYSSLTLMTMTYTTTDSDDTALMSGDGTFKADWDGNVTAAGLVNKMQAGYINITPGSTIKTYNGVKYYEGSADITFDTAFDAVPSISLTPSTAVPYKMAMGVSNASSTGFTIEFFRDSQTGTGIHWIAMPRTQ